MTPAEMNAAWLPILAGQGMLVGLVWLLRREPDAD